MQVNILVVSAYKLAQRVSSVCREDKEVEIALEWCGRGANVFTSQLSSRLQNNLHCLSVGIEMVLSDTTACPSNINLRVRLTRQFQMN